MNPFNDHARKQVDRRFKEFLGCDPDTIKDQVEEIALEIADDMRNKGKWRDALRHKWTPDLAGENFDDGLLEQMNEVFGLIIRNPGCLAIAIATASPQNRVILEKMRDLVHGSFGLLCGDLAIDKIHYDMSDL